MRHAAILVLLALAGCPHSKSDAMPPRAATPNEVIASARVVVEVWRKSYQAHDALAVSKLYSHENDLVVVHDGLPYVGWASVESMVKDHLEKHPKIIIQLKDIQVTGLGPTSATVTVGMTREIGDETTTVNETGALTLVLRRDGESWLIVTEHYSRKQVGS